MKQSRYSIIDIDFEQIFWFWPLGGLKWNTVMCREGSRTGHWSFCPSSGTKLAIKTVCVFSSAPPGCCLPQHKTVTLRLSLSFPLSLAFLVHCDNPPPHSVWELPTINMCHMPLTSQEDLSLQEPGGSINHATPYSSPPCISPPPILRPFLFPPSCFLNIELPG